MRLDEVINIDKRYQNSINLKLDAGKNEFIQQYIPTQASVRILSRYLQDIYEEGKEKSTLLVGPYGKGKSHLLLVLLRLLQDMDSAEATALIRKCANVDAEFGAKLKTYQKKPVKLMPVIVSFGRESLEASYRMAMIRSLTMFGLDELVPDSYYSVALDTIDKWKKEYPKTYGTFVSMLGESKALELVKGLKKNRKESLEKFREIHPKLTSGSRFEPLIETDVPKMFQEVTLLLQRNYGYDGIVIVFDEFSKFMEGESKANVSKDMALVQEMCELAQNSKEYKIYHICVAHKSIKEYAGYLSREVINEFTGVDGRIQEVFFDTFEKNNYELIQNVIEKKGPFDKYYNELNTKILAKSFKLATFENDFESREEFQEIVLRGCHPMTPLTTYLLLKVSAQIGQNERSLITFLANKEEHTLASYIEEESLAGSFVYPDRIFDYFAPILKKDIQNQRNHNEWQKTVVALADAETPEEQQVLKTICMIRIAGVAERIEAKEETLGIALNRSREEMREILQRMLKKEMILYREKLSSYVIRQKIDVDIEERLSAVENTQLNRVSMGTELAKLDHRKYELPRRYNHTYEMTRYFTYCFVEVEDFLKDKRGTFLADVEGNRQPDGQILLLIDRQGNREELVQKKVAGLKNPRLVVLYPKKAFDVDEIVKRLLAIGIMTKDSESINADNVLLEELAILEEEYRYKLNTMLDDLYLPEKGVCQLFYCGTWNTENLNEGLSQICESYYGKTPRINHELVNRKQVTAQIRKARGNVMERILAGQSCEDWRQGTSAEATIYRATLLHTGVDKENTQKKSSKDVEQMRKIIRNFIAEADGNSVCFAELYEILKGKKLGMREGIIPIFLAWELSLIEGLAVVYYTGGSDSMGQELVLSATVLDAVTESPKDYSLYLEKGTIEKETYLAQLEKLFDCDSKMRMSERLYTLVETMQRWFLELPLCTVNAFAKHKEYGGLCNALRERFLNPREFVFAKLGKIFGENRLSELVVLVTGAKREMELYYGEQIVKVEQHVRQIMGLAEGSLHSELVSWHHRYKDNVRSVILSTTSERVLGFAGNPSSRNEEHIINELAKILTGFYVSDWRDESIQLFEKQLKEVVKEVATERKESVEGKRHLSFTGSDGTEVEKYVEQAEEDAVYQFMTAALHDAIDEFGDSLQKEQKIAACLEVLEQLIQN